MSPPEDRLPPGRLGGEGGKREGFRRWWLLVALLLSLGVNIGVLATLAAQRLQGDVQVEAPEPPRPPRPEHLRHLGRRLELEGEQLERFVTLQQEFLRSSRSERERLHELRHEVRRRLAGPEPEMAAIEPLLEEMAASYLELERLLAAHVLVARDLLDGEAERRYLRFLSRMGPGPPGTRRGPGPGERRRPLRDRPPAPGLEWPVNEPSGS